MPRPYNQYFIIGYTKGISEDINLPCLSSRLLAPGSAGWLPLNWLTSSALYQAASLAVCPPGAKPCLAGRL